MSEKAATVAEIRDAYKRGLRAYRHMSKSLLRVFMDTEEVLLPALEQKSQVGVGLIMLGHLNDGMNALGDILSNMDAVDDEDERVTDVAFKSVRRALGEAEVDEQ
jgi:hypothetical protein